MTAPTRASLQQQLDHVDAAIMGLEDCIENVRKRQAAGKRTDTMNPFRELRLDGFRDVRATLAWLQANEAAVRAFVDAQRADRGQAA